MFSFSFSFSFLLVAHPGARTWCHACRGGRCAARYPHGLQQPANKNTLDYDVFPPMESNHRKAMPGAGNHFVK